MNKWGRGFRSVCKVLSGLSISKRFCVLSGDHLIPTDTHLFQYCEGVTD